MKEGDRNTKYFHAKASQRRRVNYDKKIQTEDGTWVEDNAEIINLMLGHIRGVFEETKGNVNLQWCN